MNSIALIRTHIEAGVGSQHTLRHLKRLVIPQHGGGKTAALHLRQLVNQHIASSHNLALEAQTATQQKRLTESTAVGEFGEVEFNAFNAKQRNIAWVICIGYF